MFCISIISSNRNFKAGRNSSVGVATRYSWTVRGSNACGGRYFLHPTRLALGPTHLSIQWIPGFFPGGKAAGA